MGDKKRALKSKTVLTGAALPLLTLIPGVRDVVASHPQEASAAVGLLMIGLRALTGDGIKF